MSARVLACVVAVLVAPCAFAADEENPFKKVKVGDYANYKMTNKIAGMTLEGTMTQTISAKTDKEVTVKVTGKVNGMDIPAQEQKIDLTKPYDPTKGGGANLPGGGEIKAEKDKDGKEKVKVGGKEYDTTWTTYKVKIKVMDQEITGEMKTWMSKDVPMGMVKMVMTADFAGQKIEMTTELKETGNKK